ncbi:hypothetical protein A11S_768 [Micavibrio aeruginosavorus EPB]|uniref:Uncharacterized protein n=1 Tax=Micavibrio aeruginosavorus EPB TaxID=349215 RepID=M4VHS3_9BACT|nr:hypothetical protein A11S_768 [Micavibrio aeruginosavorus EPB]
MGHRFFSCVINDVNDGRNLSIVMGTRQYYHNIMVFVI